MLRYIYTIQTRLDKMDKDGNVNGNGGSEQNPKNFRNLKYKASLAFWPS